MKIFIKEIDGFGAIIFGDLFFFQTEGLGGGDVGWGTNGGFVGKRCKRKRREEKGVF